MSLSTTHAVRSKKRSILPDAFRPTTVSPETVTQASPETVSFLDLPRPVRVKIWRLLGYSHTKTLRLVCSVIKEDIEKFAGISSAIDSTYDDFPFHCGIAIRKVAIHELIIPTFIEFLKYPLILQELEIRGEITVQNFHYIIKSCPNISKLLITFNNFVLDYKTPFFPLPVDSANSKRLSKLRSIKILSTTKKLPEMLYINRTLISLLRDTLPDAKIDHLHLWITHKAPSVYFKEVAWTTLAFVHKHASTLKYLSLTFRDKDQNATIAGPLENDKGTGAAGQPQATEKSKPVSMRKSSISSSDHKLEVAKTLGVKQSTSSTGRRETGIPLPPGVVITHHVKDIHSEDAKPTTTAEGEGEADVEDSKSEESNEETNIGITETTLYLESHEWPKADHLEQLWLTTSLKCMEQILNIISSNTKLHILQLETVGGGGFQCNWSVYKEFIRRSNTQSLKCVSLFAVNNVNAVGRSLPIDLGIFKKSKSLKKLSIFCQKREDYSTLSRITGLSKLPHRLTEINLERTLLSWWQITRLIVCFGDMITVSFAYWSISDCQFSLLMKILKWCFKMELTDVRQICLVDTKLRFKNKRQAVRNLQEAVAISVKYEDLDETRIIIDLGQKQDERSFAPRLSLQSNASQQSQRQRSQGQKPKRKKRRR